MFYSPNLLRRLFQKPTRVQKGLRVTSRTQSRPSDRFRSNADFDARDALLLSSVSFFVLGTSSPHFSFLSYSLFVTSLFVTVFLKFIWHIY